MNDGQTSEIKQRTALVTPEKIDGRAWVVLARRDNLRPRAR